MKQTQREVPLLGPEEEVMEFESEWGNFKTVLLFFYLFCFFLFSKDRVSCSPVKP